MVLTIVEKGKIGCFKALNASLFFMKVHDGLLALS